MDQDLNKIASRFLRFAEVECNTYSKLYRALGHAVADDDELLSFIADMPDRQPNLFFASIQYVCGADAMPRDGFSLRAAVAEHRLRIGDLMRSKRTQTNEIGRCTALLPALPHGPLAILEVGASGGLCLMLDEFRYSYTGHEIGDPKSPVLLRCTPIGSIPIPCPTAIPEIAWRRGLDLNPLDLNNPEHVEWLVACVWSDHSERRDRLKAAAELCVGRAPLVTSGDLVDDLPRLLAEVPESLTLVVIHSAVFPYLGPGRKEAFLEVLKEHSKRREIVWLSNEAPGLIPELDAVAPGRDELRFQLGRATIADGEVRLELLALAHYHGWDLEWLAA